MRKCRWNVRKSAVCMADAQYMLIQHSPWNQTVLSHRNSAVAGKTEEPYLPTVSLLSVGCLAGLCYSATFEFLVPHTLEMRGARVKFL